MRKTVETVLALAALAVLVGIVDFGLRAALGPALPLWAVALLVLGSVTGFGAYLYFSTLRHLEEVTDVVQQISEGDLTQRVPAKLTRRDDEIGDVAKSFQRMLASFKLAKQMTAPELEKEKKSLEEELSLRKAIMDATPAGVLVVDTEGNIVEYNDRFQEMWNIPEEVLQKGSDEEAIQYVLDQLEHPEAFTSRIEELYGSEEESFDVLQFKDDRVFERYSRPQRVRGERVGRVWTFLDVTEQRKREQAVDAVKDRLESIVEGAPDGIVIVDERGEIIRVNKQIEDMFGYDREELLGEKVEVLLPERFRDKHVMHRNGYMDSPRTRPMGVGLDLWGLKKSGEEFPVEISLAPIKTSQGMQVMAAVRDMTERGDNAV